MIKHNGMRPQDVVMLLKILTYNGISWTFQQLAKDLEISNSEISTGMQRNMIAGLADRSKRRVNQLALEELIVHGIKYVFPAQPSFTTKGIATAHSASPIKDLIFRTSENYVWKSYHGKTMGTSIEPLYENVIKFIEKDPELYEYLVIVDTIRVGKAREVSIATTLLSKKMEEYGKRVR